MVAFFFLQVILWSTNAEQWWCRAFTSALRSPKTPLSFTLSPGKTDSTLDSTVILFASKKKKTNAKTNKGPSQGGGQGFGGFNAFSNDSVTLPATLQPTHSNGTTGDARSTRVTAAQARKARRNRWVQQQSAEEEHDTPNTASLLESVYTNEYKKQEQRKLVSLPGRLVRVSTSPLIFTIDNFIDPDLCTQVQSNGAGCFHLMFPERLADHVFNGQESDMDGLLFNAATSQDHEALPSAYPDGLHMDTNGECLFRHVTAILYLNDVPEECGGATVFPLARTLPNDPALAASQRLIDERISHTRSSTVREQASALDADARLLETRVGSQFIHDPHTETVLRIQPKAGRLLLFFSRQANGQQDPRAWHAGERLIHGRLSSDKEVVTEKRILTLFKEVDYAHSTDRHDRIETTFESYLAPLIRGQREWLESKL